MAADRHRAFCVGAPRSLSVLRGKSDPLDTYRVCRTLRYYYKASRSSLSTGPHARNPGPRAQPPWAPRQFARFRIGILALPGPQIHSHRHRDHSSPVACCAGLSVHLLLFARESDLFGASLHARRPRPRPSAQGPPHARELGCMCMRTHAGACSQARRASSERGHLQEPTSGPSPERPRAHARTTGASSSSSSSSLAPILATSELGCAVAPPEPFPRAHTRARTHTFAQPRTATYSHVQPPPHRDAFEVSWAQAQATPPLLPNCNCTPSAAGMSSQAQYAPRTRRRLNRRPTSRPPFLPAGRTP